MTTATDAAPSHRSADSLPAEVEVAVIGAGFSGLGVAIRLRQEGYTDFVVLERGSDVGGTWWFNTYPGCQCDVPSHLYSYSFAPNPAWTRTYSKQGEIRDYLHRTADRYGVRPFVHTDTTVELASWDEDAGMWDVRTDRGALRARMLVAGMGPLAEPKTPALPGIERFKGKTMHSARWDHDYDLEGKRVASIGTGASAIQYVPQIQPKVQRLHVFQRTAPWIMPHTDRPTTRIERKVYERFPALQRVLRGAVYSARESLVLGFVKRPKLMSLVEKLARRHISEQIEDPELRAKVTPDYTIGCKRILPSNRWYPALAEPNVDLITAGVKEVREGSLVDTDGVEREVDAIVFGTGFHVTDMPIGSRVRGRDGKTLDDLWQGSPNAYLGTAIPGFPNLFMLLGPNTGLGHSSMIYMIESQIEYVMGALRTMRASGSATVEVRPEVARRFNERVDRALEGTVWNTGCASWYLDDTGRNATLWPDWTWRFRRRTSKFEPDDYSLSSRSGDRGAGRMSETKRFGARRSATGSAPPASKRVLITGAAGGIGSAATAELRSRGATVVGLDLHASGDDVIACDVRDQASVDAAVTEAIDRLNGLDVLINNAGVGDPQSAGAAPDEKALAVIDVNLVGPWRVTSAALPALRDSGGRVVNVASGLAHVTVPFATAYCMSKRGVVAYSDALRLEHGDRIGVTTVYPGYIRTKIHEASAAVGLSLEGTVPAERVEDAAHALTRASLDSPVRDLATTRQGTVSYAVATRLPRGLMDRLLRSRTRKLARGGHFERSEMAREFSTRSRA